MATTGQKKRTTIKDHAVSASITAKPEQWKAVDEARIRVDKTRSRYIMDVATAQAKRENAKAAKEGATK